MRANVSLRSVFAMTAVATAGCGAHPAAESGNFPDAPFAVLAGDQGNLTIEVRTAPSQPPQAGVARVQLVVKDSKGSPIEGLAVSAVPYMPAMGHGTSVQPSVNMDSSGVYVLDNVYLYMPGHWELRTAFSGSVMDRAVPAFDVR